MRFQTSSEMDIALDLSLFFSDFDGQAQTDNALNSLGKHVSINGQLVLTDDLVHGG